MITNPDWLKAKTKPYFHQISLECVEKLVECMEGIDIEDMDCDLTISQNQDLRPVHSLLRQKPEYFHRNTLYVYGRRLYSLLTSDILKHFYKCFYPRPHRTT